MTEMAFVFCTNTHCCFQVEPSALIVRKGVHSHIESYSAFWDNAKLSETLLRQDMQCRDVTDVFVCGIAYDHCVGESLNRTKPSLNNFISSHVNIYF